MGESATKKALIAMSGGVDSSVAARCMCREGYSCMGATMKLFDGETKSARTCCSQDDVEDAWSVAQRLHMPYYVFNFKEAFDKRVIAPFVQAYLRGETPNPCIDCNRFLKFEALFQRMQELQMDVLATGHYARVVYDEGRGRWLLKSGLDAKKDQSYVLYHLTQEQLAHVRFPLGDKTKERVRAIAEENGFLNAKKPESQDICFVPNGDYASFIEKYTGNGAKPGSYLNMAGEHIGTHQGIWHYTIGQRRGIRISAPQPLYVCRIDPVANTVSLGVEAALYAKHLVARDINWIALPTLTEPLPVFAKIRYRQPAQPATCWLSEGGALHVFFDTPQRAITCGQAVVLYQGDTVLGGGTIARVLE